MAGVLLQNAITKAGSLNQVAVRDSLRTIDLETFMGRVTFGVDGANNISPVVVRRRPENPKMEEATQILFARQLQYINGTRRVISPPLLADANPVYPYPTWSERKFAQNFGSPVEIVVTVVTCIAFVVSFVLIGLTLFFWTNPIIRARSPTFLLGILAGSLFLYGHNFAAMVNVVTPASCHLQAWLLALGFVIQYGSLFAKVRPEKCPMFELLPFNFYLLIYLLFI